MAMRWRRKVRATSPIAESAPGEGVTRADGGTIVDGTVEELLNAVRELLKDESDRAASFIARATGLTGFVGILLSVAAAAVAAVGTEAGVGLHEWVRISVGVLIALAFASLVLAVIAAVAKVLLPSQGFTFKTSEVQAYPTWKFISRDRVSIQGHLMKGYVAALVRDRVRNEEKAKWLSRSYKLVCFGLVLVAIAGTAATLDRYVTGRETDSNQRQRQPARPGTTTTGGNG